MDWNPGTWKSIWKNEKNRWLLLLAAGLICLLLAVPSGLESGPEPAGEESGSGGVHGSRGRRSRKKNRPEPMKSGWKKRLEEILSRVEGVGTAEVMIVLKSSEEKVWRVDRNTSDSRYAGNGSERRQPPGGKAGNCRKRPSLPGQGGGTDRFWKRKLFPEIGGVVVSADGRRQPVGAGGNFRRRRKHYLICLHIK